MAACFQTLFLPISLPGLAVVKDGSRQSCLRSWCRTQELGARTRRVNSKWVMILSEGSIKQSILQIGAQTKRGVSARPADVNEMEDLIEQLLVRSTPGHDPKALASNFSLHFAGRWNLRFSTESALVSLMRGSWPFPPADLVFQDVVQVPEIGSAKDQGRLSNHVNFGEYELVVQAVYNTEIQHVQNGGTYYRCPFQFKSTDVLRSDQRVVQFPFAIGSGFFDVLYLDAQLRIDQDKNGWINVYSYDGPVEKCKQPLNRR